MSDNEINSHPSLRAPNKEQKLAIEHTGGMLLAAGAGSGKTFVLVEHIIYLINKFLEEKEELVIEELENEMKIYLSKIVLMTFTNKAAGELSIRLKNRLDDELSLNSCVHKNFHLAIDAIESMTVGTIHGFCFKLLNQGFFPNISKGVAVIDDIESKHRIESLTRQWFDELNKDETTTKLVKDIFFRHYDQVITSMCGIFGSPDLRMHWNKLDIDEALNFNLEDIFNIILHEKGILNPLESDFNLAIFEEHKSKKWFTFIELFEKNKSDLDFGEIESLRNLSILLEGLRSARAPSKIENVDMVKDYLGNLRLLKKELPELLENIEMYYDHKDTYCKSQISCFKSAFDYINKHYFEESGLTFSDLEFLVLKGLETPEIVKRISDSYQYFIVDEFQDTSEVQFQMITQLINNDFNKLFCVGDMKQAIYGFRGGELGVFKACMKRVKNISMTNNYRSSKNVINFNNQLFFNIFPKSYKFSGKEIDPVPVEFQSFPDVSINGEGDIFKRAVTILDEQGPLNANKTSQVDYAESLKIYEQIKFFEEKNEGNVCILYKKLSPSNYLISELIKNNVGFTAQIKIPSKEDFNLGLFYLFLNILVGDYNVEGEEFKTNLKLINAYLETLGISVSESLQDSIQKFIKNHKLIGLVDSFQKFLFEMKLSNSNFENNIITIQKIINLSHEDLGHAKLLFEENFENRYSIDFRYGENSSNVIIMTAHASKGLEFDHVILGGTHSNARKRGNDSFLGKTPGSFKWKAHSSQKRPYQTPQLLLERALEKKKEFQESKRLFYVACTRAIKSLSWVDLKGSKSELSYGGESWIDGIRSFENDFANNSKQVLTEIKSNMKYEDIDWTFSDEEINAFNNRPPMFHVDELGNYHKTSLNNESLTDSYLGTLCELSVTRLSNLIECPRKFYLANILKLSGEEINVDENVKLFEEEIITKHDGDDHINKNVIIDIAKSSATRGTKIHSAIEYAIKNDFFLPSDLTDKRDIEAVNYVIDLLSEYNNQVHLISEEPLKFLFFNFMISGIPDLVILNNSNCVEIWDYKTGSNKVENPAYKMQLMCYAYACVQLGHCLASDKIKCKLVYVDQKDIVLYQYSFDQLTQELFGIWKKADCFDEVNPNHCSKCQFGNMCPDI
ncbi:MAG: UvrD-helicase domain-containing protein [Bacteriovoracaceae bacterium]|jgi:ATP-dependent helicase/nuclease subunit A|nr:UvrD-helicase domain-containing protein [Bacteriovoracaceae bacterium]